MRQQNHNDDKVLFDVHSNILFFAKQILYYTKLFFIKKLQYLRQQNHNDDKVLLDANSKYITFANKNKCILHEAKLFLKYTG